MVHLKKKKICHCLLTLIYTWMTYFLLNQLEVKKNYSAKKHCIKSLKSDGKDYFVKKEQKGL